MRAWTCLAALAVMSGCRKTDGEPPPAFIDVPCTPDQAAPYPSGLPYVGIHVNAANDDVVQCDTASAFAQDWHVLQGHAVMQPSTMSPDGQVIYVTATSPDPEGCTLFALDVADGAQRWCRDVGFEAVASSVEVDEDGQLHLTSVGHVIALTPDGDEVWAAPLWPDPAAPEPEEMKPHNGYGVHFTPDGDITTVTASGLVVLIDRATGARLASLDLPQAFGLVPPPESLLSGFDLIPLFPPEVIADVEGIFGDRAGDALGSFFGAGDNFSDNTVAVSGRGEIYVIGGGPTEDTGALVQVKITAGPGLAAGWHTVTRPGSAATPSITPDGRWVITSDGSATRDLMDPEQADATVVAVDVDACDANLDADPDPDRCAAAWDHPLERGAMPGAPAVLADGTTWFYELGMSLDSNASARDLVRVGPEGVTLEVVLPDALEWNSVLTVTDRFIIGTASTITPSDVQLAGITLPATADDHLLLVDRSDGSIAFQASLPDDSAATVAIGPDGSLYAGLLGLVSMLAIDERPTLGLVRFRPVE